MTAPMPTDSFRGEIRIKKIFERLSAEVEVRVFCPGSGQQLTTTTTSFIILENDLACHAHIFVAGHSCKTVTRVFVKINTNLH